MPHGKSTERLRRNGPDSVETLPAEVTVAPPAAPDCGHTHVERARWEWRVGDGGDPAALVQEFLAAHGLALDDLARPAGRIGQRVCGAALYVSAAAGALGVGRGPGPATPAPALPEVAVVVYGHAPASRGRPARRRSSGWWLGAWAESWAPWQHADAVRAVRAAIGRGDVYQVNLVGHAAARYAGDPLPALARLGALPGARYAGVLTGAGWAIGCASPETLVEVTDGRMITRPIKGTRPATAAGRTALLSSAKERAEHVMIVDLQRNDLARLARTGTVTVDELFAVRRWCDLWQAESTVSAAVAEGLGLADLLRAVCPGGSVTGAPKLAALDHIAALEPVGRGASMGALGWVTPGRVDLGLTIRTAAADADQLHVWAGGGITWGSDPEAEVAEAAAKSAPVRAALAARP
ncbi:chorismate-binding protein [Salinispora tropica]|uniref:Anthranilate synthase component I and chorismate binding protein n=1 Tax=Salinispora tropica (strain ATCC BAA-916 / DSM 44818 / JCM 13857 / NBRC 105044 / CNB-440) TaxID=369723 RepID=A4X7H2_SALTO|nr:chorismate-binding protein [Salinispora tropica]ABP54822.1 Anthranilate synthase component I and chorismate binding protein [Salinispora tropica CNB-440]